MEALLESQYDIAIVYLFQMNIKLIVVLLYSIRNQLYRSSTEKKQFSCIDHNTIELNNY
jgi:hypothetical protein